MTEQKNESVFIRTNTAESLTETFVHAIARRYHYENKDMKKLRQVAADIRQAVEREEGFYLVLPQEEDKPDAENWLMNAEKIREKKQCAKEKKCYAGVALTLGKSLDELQDEAQERKDMEGAYMIEVIAGEMLRNAYAQFSDYLKKNSDYEAAAFEFFGSSEEFSLEQMTSVLKYVPEQSISVTKGYCLKPKKSVVFLAELKSKEDEKKSAHVSLCGKCQKKDCAFRS